MEWSPLLIHISCVKNCNRYLLSDQISHFHVACENCKKNEAVAIEWMLEGNLLARSSRLVLKEEFFAPGSIPTISVKVSQNNRMGETNTSMEVAPLIQDGICLISPTHGEALKTLFSVTCKDFKDKFPPFKFNVYQNKIQIYQFSENQFEIRLGEMKDKEIQIKMENRYGASKLFNLNPIVKNFDANLSEIEELVHGNSSLSLSHLIASNDFARSTMLFDVLVHRIEISNENLAELMLDNLKSVKMTDINSIMAVSSNLENFAEKFEANYRIRGAIGRIFEKIGEALDSVFEVRDS